MRHATNHRKLCNHEQTDKGIQKILEGWVLFDDSSMDSYPEEPAALLHAAATLHPERSAKLLDYLTKKAVLELHRVFPAGEVVDNESLRQKWPSRDEDRAARHATAQLLKLVGKLPPDPVLWEKIKEMWRTRQVPTGFPTELGLLLALTQQQLDDATRTLWIEMIRTNGNGEDGERLYPGGNMYAGFRCLYALAANLRTPEGIAENYRLELAAILATSIVEEEENTCPNNVDAGIRRELLYLFARWNVPSGNDEERNFIELYNASLPRSDREYAVSVAEFRAYRESHNY